VELAVDRPQNLEDLAVEEWEVAVGFDQAAGNAACWWYLE